MIDSETSRCWAPSCRSRSIRRRAGVAGGDQPRARGAQVVVASAQFGGQALVLERERRGRARRAHQLALLQQCRVMHDRRDRCSVALDLGHRAVSARSRQLHSVPARIDIASRVGQPVGERERVVAQRLGQRVARADPAEPLEQRADRARPRQARAQQAHQEGERQRRDQHDQHDIDDLRQLIGAESDREHAGHAHNRDRGPRPHDRSKRAPLDPAETAPASDQHHAQTGEQDHRDDKANRLHDRRRRATIPGQQQVVRAVTTVVRPRGHDCRRQRQSDRRRPAQGPPRHARAPGARGRSGTRPACAPARRSRARRRAARACTPTPHRRSQRTQEPHEPDERHQRPDAVLRAPPPGKDARAREAPTQRQREHDPRRRIGLVAIASRDQRERRQPERKARNGKRDERAAKAAHEQTLTAQPPARTTNPTPTPSCDTPAAQPHSPRHRHAGGS